MTYIKPASGIRPRYIWLQERWEDLGVAISKRIEAGQVIPLEWVEEYNALDKEIYEINRSKQT